MKSNTIKICLTINGEKKKLDIPAGMTALEAIRDRLGLKGTKEGCGIGECGACTIIVDGRAVNACLMFAAQLDGRQILTVEGLAQNGDLDPIQEAFAQRHAVQCGFCTPGLLMSTRALLSEQSNPDRSEIVKAISGNLCRCTGYRSIVAAIEEAARRQPKKDQ
ncbi:MAG: (2Fe-2S)-binding protein [Desulfobacterales bacterium]|jgi:carbon-monoxide dehydrogenase small subunit